MSGQVTERFEDKLPAELVQDLRWVQTLIAEQPQQFDMRNWVVSGTSPCNTVGCIAGHIAIKRMPKQDVDEAFAGKGINPRIDYFLEHGQ